MVLFRLKFSETRFPLDGRTRRVSDGVPLSWQIPSGGYRDDRESGPLGYAAANSLQAKCLQLCVYVRCSENRRPNRRWGSSHPEPKKCDLFIKRVSAICSVESRAVSTIDQYIYTIAPLFLLSFLTPISLSLSLSFLPFERFRRED